MSEQSEPGFVYFAQCDGGIGPIKIGYTKNPPQRLEGLAMWAPFPMSMIAIVPGSLQLEARFHTAFKEHRQHGEWFAAAPPVLDKVEEIRAGLFSPESLPPREKRPWCMAAWSPDRVEARSLHRKFTYRSDSLARIDSRFAEPNGVRKATEDFEGLSEVEREACRLAVSDFLAETSTMRGLRAYIARNPKNPEAEK